MKFMHLGACWCLIVVLLVAVCLTAAEAAEETWYPRVSLQWKYDDNIRYSSRNKVRDWIYEVRPELTWQRRTERGDDLRLTARLLGQKYDTESELDTLDQDYFLVASSQVRPNLRLSFNGGYRKDTTLDSELSEEGILLFREDRKVYRLNPSVRWQATERSAWLMDIPFHQENYEEQDDFDYTSTGIGLGYSRMLADDRTNIFVQSLFSYDDFEMGDTHTYEMMCGVDRAFSERLVLRASGGVHFSRIKEGTKTSTETGFSASIEAHGELERGHWRASYLRDVYPGGIGRTVLRDRVTFYGAYQISRRLRLTGQTSFTDVRSQGDGDYGGYYLPYYEDFADYWTLHISPGLVYRLAEHANLGIYYRHRFLDNQENNQTYRRNMFWISLDFTTRFAR